MAESQKQPGRMGRPVTVKATTGLMVKMSDAMRGAITKRAKAERVTLSEAARRLLAYALQHMPKGKPRRDSGHD